jgi:mRNA interferase HicA
MKRRTLLGHLQEHGCHLLREGGSHSVWVNPQTGRRETVPRHNDIKKHLAKSICRNRSVPIPPED